MREHTLKEDWDELRLRQPVTETGDLLELEHDWDLVQGRESWFLALYEGKSRIPGTLTRSCFGSVVRIRLPFGGRPTRVGFWQTGQKLRFNALRARRFKPGRSLLVQLAQPCMRWRQRAMSDINEDRQDLRDAQERAFAVGVPIYFF